MLLRELLERRADVVQEARDMVDKADRENRGLNQAEQKRYDEIFAEVNKLEARMKIEEVTMDMDKRSDHTPVALMGNPEDPYQGLDNRVKGKPYALNANESMNQ